MSSPRRNPPPRIGEPQNPGRYYLQPYSPVEFPYVQQPQNQYSYAASGSDRGSAKDILRVLRKRYWIILGVALTCFLFGFLYSAFAPRLYIAKTTLEIRGYDSLLNSIKADDAIEQDTRKTSYQRTTTAKLKQIGLANESLKKDNLAYDLKRYFKSRRTAIESFTDYIKESLSGKDEFAKEPVIDAVPNDDKLFSFSEDFLKSYLGLIDVTPLNETSLVKISVVTTSPSLSQRIANQHADVFIDVLRKERQAELSSNLQALELHSKLLKEKLSTAEKAMSEYAKKNSLLAVTASNRNSKEENLVVKGISELSSLLAVAKGQRINAESALSQFRISSQTGRVTDDDKLIQSLRLSLKEAEAQYAALNSKVTSEYPALKEIGAQVQSLKKSLAEEKEIKLKNLEAQYESSLATEKELISELEKEQSKVNDSSSKLVNYNLLAQEVESLRLLTDSVLQEQLQTQIAAASSKSNIFVTDYAALSTRPISPKKKLIFSFSIILGLFLGLAIAVLVEILNNRIETSEDAEEALGLPVLGSILSFKVFKDETGEFADKDDNLLGRARKLLPFLRPEVPEASQGLPTPPNIEIPEKDISKSESKDIGLVANSKKSGLVSISSPNAAVSEALRSIRASILFSSADAPPKVICVTSANIGEGKTTVCTNLAVTLAQASYKTLLIDGDLRSPSCASKFGMSNDRMGLVDFLTGQVTANEAFVETEVPGLHFLGAGSASPKPSELIGSRKMAELVELLRNEFDYILIDSAPVLPVSDSLTLASVVDGMIFVVRSGGSERPSAKEAVRRLERVGANILGVVVNDLALRFSPYAVQSYYPQEFTRVFEGTVKSGHDASEAEKKVVGL